MSNGKFISGQMHKFTIKTQKIANAQKKSTAKYLGRRYNGVIPPDIFETKNKAVKPQNPVMDILTGKAFQKNK